jgi:predicted GNAT superfamily acetyltransferase
LTVSTLIRQAKPTDFASIAALNADSERFLSPMSETRVERLHGWAAYHRVIERNGAIAAFLLAFREGAAYDSPNYRWFSERYPSFFYIDRVVVAPAYRGNGLATCMYLDVFAFARKSGVATVTCEFDIEPPNDVSRSFHEKLGFHEVGSHAYNNKRVSMQAR